MAYPVAVGSGHFSYRVDKDWERLPTHHSHGDVPGVAVDSSDRLYVFNRSEHPVMVYEPDGTFIRSWGDGVFGSPHGITIGPDDVAYCVDSSHHTVRKFTLNGDLLQTFGTPGIASDTGAVGYDYRSIRRGAAPFNRPTNLAVGPSGDLFISDGYGNARVHRFAADGTLKLSWGEPGAGPGQFNVPHGIVVDAMNRVLVADRENSRVQLFDVDGRFIEEWSDLARPSHMAIGPEGHVYIAELGPAGPFSFTAAFPPDYPPSRLSIYSQFGVLITRLGTLDACAPGSFFAAHGICVDSHGNVYVGEVNRSAVLDEFDVPIRSHASLESLPAGCHTLQKLARIS
jgi:DNA-binding beta-propeller fold protein YncE